MEKIATENLFLLEFLVDSVNLDPKCDCALGEGNRCVSFQFLDNAPLDVCQDNKPVTETDSVKSGKSCLFSLTPNQATEAMNKFDVYVTLFKTMPEGWLPEKVEIGEALISIANLFADLITGVETSDGTTPIAKTLKDSFQVTKPDGTAVGKIGVYIRMSCFGKLIVTQFQMNLDDKSVLFRDKEGKSLYRYKKAGKGRKGKQEKRETCTPRTGEMRGMPPGMGGMPPGMGCMMPGMGGMPPGMGGMPPGMGGMPPGMGGMPPGMGGMPPGMGGMPPGMGYMPPGMGGMPPGMGNMPPGMGGMHPGRQRPSSAAGACGMDCCCLSQTGLPDEKCAVQPPPCHECSGFAKSPCAPNHPGNGPNALQTDPNCQYTQGILARASPMGMHMSMGPPAIMSMGAAMPMGGGMPMSGGLPPCMECGNVPDDPGIYLPYGMGGMPLSPCMECGNIPNTPCLFTQGMGMDMGPPRSNTPCMECSSLPSAPCGAPPCSKRTDTPCVECAGTPNPPCGVEPEPDGNYQEIGATMGGNTLTIRVHKDKNKIEQIDPNAPPADSDDESQKGCCCCSPKKKKERTDRDLEMRPGVKQGNKEMPFAFKVSKSKNAANNVVVNPPVAIAKDGTRFTEFSDPNKELFVLRVGKRSEGVDKKQNLELELCTPRGKVL